MKKRPAAPAPLAREPSPAAPEPSPKTNVAPPRRCQRPLRAQRRSHPARQRPSPGWLVRSYGVFACADRWTSHRSRRSRQGHGGGPGQRALPIDMTELNPGTYRVRVELQDGTIDQRDVEVAAAG